MSEDETIGELFFTFKNKQIAWLVMRKKNEFINSFERLVNYFCITAYDRAPDDFPDDECESELLERTGETI